MLVIELLLTYRRVSSVYIGFYNALPLKDERAFSKDEEEKLQAALGLESDDLYIVLETCTFILEQAAYHNAKAQLLKLQLQNIELTDEKTQAIVDLWTSNGKSVVEKLKQRSLAPKQLQAVSWRLNLQMAQSNATKMKLPNAMMEFSVASGRQGVREKVHVEFTHEELYALYNQVSVVLWVPLYCGSPTYRLSKNLPNVLKLLTDESRQKLQSTENFMDAIKTIQIPDDQKLVSFDVFTSIPLQLALDCTENAIRTLLLNYHYLQTTLWTCLTPV
ncbi:unnamed protein product [Porites evermanni]|uniref:COMM domain-containing protein n=1 Tax=Porites evermanni TaxID=104178 RepID=A0ABN8LSG3_9CNID|nr:unnamed protein product [Porites evermanni]